MDISVVIPAYNEEAYIGDCLKALKAQTLAPLEIIVVDNASTDRTAEIARSYGVRVISESVRGITAARDAGFAAAKGSVLARTDADTRVHPDWIAQIHRHVTQGETALTGMIYYDFPLMDEYPQIYESFQTISRLMLGHWVFIGSNMVLTRELWQKALPHCCRDDSRVHDDIELSLAVSRYTKIVYSRDIKVHASARRVRENPKSFFVEYQLRFSKQIWEQKKRQAHEHTDDFADDIRTGIGRGKTFTDEMLAQITTRIKAQTTLPDDLKQFLTRTISTPPTSKLKDFQLWIVRLFGDGDGDPKST